MLELLQNPYYVVLTMFRPTNILQQNDFIGMKHHVLRSMVNSIRYLH